MLSRNFITITLLLLTPLLSAAQTNAWKQVQKGNRAFDRKDYTAAELHYLGATGDDLTTPVLNFNLGNVQLGKGSAKASLEYFERVSNSASADTTLRAMAYHNQGYIYQASAMSSTREDERQKLLQTAIKHYKQALRLNPSDDNTRYNLALCQKLLKDSQQQQQQSQQLQETSESTTRQEQQPTEQPQKDEKQNQQLLNLAKQAEKRAKEKVDKAMKNKRPKNLEKNW
jgi:Ca-activated chloride channel family protein